MKFFHCLEIESEIKFNQEFAQLAKASLTKVLPRESIKLDDKTGSSVEIPDKKSDS